jgi:hypothetical protein
LGKKFVYDLKVLPCYQRIMDPRGTQTLEGGMTKKNKGFYEGERGRCAL